MPPINYLPHEVDIHVHTHTHTHVSLYMYECGSVYVCVYCLGGGRGDVVAWLYMY